MICEVANTKMEASKENEMKIENEYMTVKFDEEGKTLIDTNKDSNEYYELDVFNRTIWAVDSNSNGKFYMEWSKN